MYLSMYIHVYQTHMYILRKIKTIKYKKGTEVQSMYFVLRAMTFF